MQKIYTNEDIQDMLTAVKKSDTLRTKILSCFSEDDRAAMADVLDEGWYERFDRYDSDVCEQFIRAYNENK